MKKYYKYVVILLIFMYIGTNFTIKSPIFAQSNILCQTKTNEVFYNYDCIKAELLIKDNSPNSYLSLQNINEILQDMYNQFNTTDENFEIKIIDFFYIKDTGYSNIEILCFNTNFFDKLKIYLTKPNFLLKKIYYSLSNYQNCLGDAIKQTEDLLLAEMKQTYPNCELRTNYKMDITTKQTKTNIVFVITISSIFDISNN